MHFKGGFGSRSSVGISSTDGVPLEPGDGSPLCSCFAALLVSSGVPFAPLPPDPGCRCPLRRSRSNLDGAVIVAAVSVDFAVVAGGIAVALVVHGFRRNPRFIPGNWPWSTAAGGRSV